MACAHYDDLGHVPEREQGMGTHQHRLTLSPCRPFSTPHAENSRGSARGSRLLLHLATLRIAILSTNFNLPNSL